MDEDTKYPSLTKREFLAIIDAFDILKERSSTYDSKEIKEIRDKILQRFHPKLDD